MDVKLIDPFLMIMVPIIFFFADLFLHAELDLSIDECGSDLLLINASVCFSRIIELLNERSQQIKPAEYIAFANSSIKIYLFILGGILFLWVASLFLIGSKSNENWEYIGGEDAPSYIAFGISILITIIVMVFYTTIRMY